MCQVFFPFQEFYPWHFLSFWAPFDLVSYSNSERNVGFHHSNWLEDVREEKDSRFRPGTLWLLVLQVPFIVPRGLRNIGVIRSEKGIVFTIAKQKEKEEIYARKMATDGAFRELLKGWLIDWMIDWFTDCSVDWLIDWFNSRQNPEVSGKWQIVIGWCILFIISCEAMCSHLFFVCFFRRFGAKGRTGNASTSSPWRC